MKSKSLQNVLPRIEAWPAEAQDRLADIVRGIDAEIADGLYEATDEELRLIDEAVAAVDRGEIASPEEVEAAFAKFRTR
jgi:hypothetical protein